MWLSAGLVRPPKWTNRSGQLENVDCELLSAVMLWWADLTSKVEDHPSTSTAVPSSSSFLLFR
jgi:hypothetical protein